ncbi:MAG: pectinesterase [Chitinophagaceae bacterium]|nr:MAG: pectinesterase [Chitinophagaceae bacterium]
MAYKTNKLIHQRFLYCFLVLAFFVSGHSFAQKVGKRIVVAQTGKADYRSIQGAINSLSDSSTVARTIYIRNGVYREKIYLEKHNIIFEGQSREKTIITQAIARDEWRCSHNEDWGVATLNINSSDITLINLSVVNSYGFDNDSTRFVYCPSDTSNADRMKGIRQNSHQMALRTMNGTRLKAINCLFRAYAGDTVSPWNTENGMFYFKDCIMEGGVDFYCPRGWAYAEGCRFITHTGDAAIWHDGSRYRDSKTVLVNCSFEGYDGFRLGRYHREAQFYLINCSFADNMADKPIYLVPTATPIKWGERIYFFNCNRKAGNYPWFANNLQKAEGNPSPNTINATWVFGNRWNPITN